jgi:hypothetical protein
MTASPRGQQPGKEGMRGEVSLTLSDPKCETDRYRRQRLSRSYHMSQSQLSSDRSGLQIESEINLLRSHRVQ